MKALAKYWKALVAVLLILVAVIFYFDKYKVEKAAYESQTNQLETTIMVLERNIQENLQYADIQDELEDAKAEIDASRLELYKTFPVEMKEEDQIMYVLYLETLFKEEIFFTFNQAAVKQPLNDGAALQYLELSVNYKTTYKGFQNMVDYLSTDSRVASVREATIDYDAENDIAVGLVKLWLYMMDTTMLEYQKPDVAVPETGKENIFEHRSAWVSKNGRKYHNDPSCGGMKNPTEITLEEAHDRGLTACSKCYVIVWVEKYGSIYHGDRRCRDMEDPVQISLDMAIILGRKSCTKCAGSVELLEAAYVDAWSKGSEIVTSSASEGVWVSEHGDKYHKNSDCSNMENPALVPVDVAKNMGRTACSKCY